MNLKALSIRIANAVLPCALAACSHLPNTTGRAAGNDDCDTPVAAAPKRSAGTPTPPAASGAALQGAPGTALLVVRFANEVNPSFQPTNLAMTVEAPAQRGQFVFRPYRAVPGQFAEFLVRLDLPPGAYRITRLFGVAGEGQTAPQFDFPAEQRFTVEAGQTAYLGRIEVINRLRRQAGDTATGPALGHAAAARAGFAAGSPRVTAHDETEQDLVSFRTQWLDLRERRIATVLPLSFAVPAPAGSALPGVQALYPKGGMPSGEFVTAQALGDAAAGALPAALRTPFSRFTVAKRPRAFAYDPVGAGGVGQAFGMVSGGQEVIARALRQCEAMRGPLRRPGAGVGGAGTACVLYAIDDTVVADGLRQVQAAGAVPVAPR